MELSIVLEQRFARTPDGAITTEGAMHHAFWRRYLRDFDSVRIVARVEDVPACPAGHRRVDGERVTVHAVPAYIGPAQFVLRRHAVVRSLREAMTSASGAILLRTPGTLATVSYRALRSLRSNGIDRPYGVEVVGDPIDVFAPGALSHPFRAYFRYHFARAQKRLCRHASAALYVTESTLQRRYPTRAFSVAASNVELTDAAFVADPNPGALRSPDAGDADDADDTDDADDKDAAVTTVDGHAAVESDAAVAAADSHRLRVAFVGSLEQLYKGPDVLLKALARCRESGLRVEATLIGDGRRRSDMEALARRLGLTDQVRFTGYLSDPASVRARLDAADVFVLPSRTEGLPRALLEAMARGLPCIASRVGGIPELVSDEALCAPGDDAALASQLRRLARDASFRQRLARQGIETARRFHEDILDARRRAFYRALADATARWRGAASPVAGGVSA